MAKLDLDLLAPDRHELVFRGTVYFLPGETPIETLVEAIKAISKVEDLDDDGDNISPEEADVVGGALLRLKEIVMDLIRVEQPDAESLPLGLASCARIIGFIIRGETASAEIQQAIADAIGPPAEATDSEIEDAERGGIVPPTPPQPTSETDDPAPAEE